MTHLFLINPAAGKRDRSSEYRKAIETACKGKGLDYRIEVSQAPGDCRRLAREAAQSGEEYRIYACGGDGTLNEVVSGAAGYPNVSVTHYAGGSGNDFVKIFSEPAAFLDIARLLDCEEAEFDLIDCNGDLGLNTCSVGLDARIGNDMVNYKRLPLISGSGAYLLSAAVNTVKGVSEHYVVEINGEVMDGQQTLILASNGRFYGGGFNPVPVADPADGLLDVLLVTKVSRLKVLTVIDKYKNGLFAQFPDLIRHVRTDRVLIRCDKPTSLNLDGELRVAETVDIRVAKEKIRFFYPKGLTWQAKVPAGANA